MRLKANEQRSGAEHWLTTTDATGGEFPRCVVVVMVVESLCKTQLLGFHARQTQTLNGLSSRVWCRTLCKVCTEKRH